MQKLLYVGILQQQRKNNIRSFFLLLGFPSLILAAVWAFLLFTTYDTSFNFELTNNVFLKYIPYILIGVIIWFTIAYFAHSMSINKSAGSETLERRTNKRVYNLVENLCISQGMKMPKLRIIQSDALNAFASGINEKTYTVTLTQGIIETLEDDELEGVIAHELMHIKNNDVRLLIISIIFVGIFSFLVNIIFRNILFGRGKKKDIRIIIISLVISLVVYLISILFKFALSKKREYMADAGAAEMTKKPLALASALRKISGNHKIDSFKSEELAQLCIENSPEKSSFSLKGLFSTHPPIDKRIGILERF